MAAGSARRIAAMQAKIRRSWEGRRMKLLADQMAMYSAYHLDPRNRATHVVGVPLIAFSLLLPMTLLRVELARIDVSLATAFTAGVLIYYFMLDRLMAIISVIVFGLLLAFAEYVAASVSTVMLW